MEKLKKIIELHGNWSGLNLYVSRIEVSIETDFSNALENAKALLESICKEICTKKGKPQDSTSSINAVLKNAFTLLGYNNSSLVNQISTSLANIGQQLGNLRNEIGATSHGKPLEELKEINNRVDLLTKEFLIDSVIIVASFMIRAFEKDKPIFLNNSDDVAEPLIKYTENEDFNDFWDDNFGEFEMGEYSFNASEVLFNCDYQAYLIEYDSYRSEEIIEG